MSFQLPTESRARFSQPSWSGVAFLVEAMLLLVFLIASLAMFTQLFGQAIERSTSGETLSRAVAAVSNSAEAFAADPEAVESVQYLDDLVVVCEVSDEKRPGGTLYRATISAYAASPDELGSSEVEVVQMKEGEIAQVQASELSLPEGAQPVYTVSTSRYESEVG